MTNQFSVDIPSPSGNPFKLSISVGDVFYVLGANGTGKSSLISWIAVNHRQQTKRISAHRQTWFESNAVNLTPSGRDSTAETVRDQDTQLNARNREWNPGARANLAIFDLIDADTTQARKITDLLRNGKVDTATSEAQTPSPIQTINEIMRLSNLPISIAIAEGQKIVACKNGGTPYSAAELSDGERNAFLIAADVLTAKAGTLLLIDEPERHLHRSIISPLLRLLFDHRKDCAFVVSTHEPMLSLDTPSATTILVRGCEYKNQQVSSWTVDTLEPGAAIDDTLKTDILGSRKKIMFVEGKAQSLDMPLYSLLFPQLSVVPKGSCREVEQAVRGLKGADGIHWVSCWGIIDNDQRSPDEVAQLEKVGVWAIPHYSVESLYYNPKIIVRIAGRQAAVIGGDADSLYTAAISEAISGAKENRNHLIASAVVHAVRRRFLDCIPNNKDKKPDDVVKLEIEVLPLRAMEETRFDKLVADANFDGLLTRYPLRESSALEQVVKALKFADRMTYQSAVLKLLQDEPAALDELRKLLGGLYAQVSA
jgi:ABC-type cobalamin/Fe3+-siderophores transport system ATPase subunit